MSVNPKASFQSNPSEFIREHCENLSKQLPKSKRKALVSAHIVAFIERIIKARIKSEKPIHKGSFPGYVTEDVELAIKRFNEFCHKPSRDFILPQIITPEDSGVIL